ncbi:MAG: cytochrome c3 family protein [Xanthomonadales bacterium]|jgi:hypothetical protein|nr:cytochrome c3 family protein [Xanthomonadales bacterium]MDH3999694.1 cytochrome c3 family protein [Xanthomonadales bacterium]
MKSGIKTGILLVAIALLGMAPAIGLADHHEEVSNPDLKCLKCHSKNLKKKLEDGEKMSLRIEVEEFGSSVHKVIGCTGCHRDVAKGKHPSKQPIASRRAYSLKHNQTCSQCHEAAHESYRNSVHASMVEHGDDNAPLCSDCHSAHAIQSRVAYEPVNGEPCSRCHTKINEAFEQSIHGLARSEGNLIRGDHVQAPSCTGCHNSHDISAVTDTDYLVPTCISCHEVAELAHEQWLPNAGMHLKSVGCAACHSPQAELRVDLQLYDRLRQAPVRQNENNGTVQETLAAIDTNGDGLDPVELWKLVRQINDQEEVSDITLLGRLEVTNSVDAHRLAASTEAVRSCESCHRSDAEPFQNVTVSLSRKDGRKESFKADRKVLASAMSVDSVGGFYAPGGTRIKLLDGLLVLAILGGLAVPVVHISLGKILRKKKQPDNS